VAAKKRLEIGPSPLEDDGAEARFENERRLELTTKSGSVHRGFSHESGTVKIDDTGVAEYRERSELERQERMERLRTQLEKEDEKLRHLSDPSPAQKNRDEALDQASGWGRSALIALTVYFALRGIYELVCLALGRPATEFWPFVTLAILSMIVLSVGRVPARLVRIFARFAYAFALLYFGVRGIISLAHLYRHPPARGVDWSGAGWHLFGVALTVVALSVFGAAVRSLYRKRAAVIEALDANAPPELPFGITYTNRDQLRYYLYSIEGTFLVMGLLVFNFFYLCIEQV
jgi:hypothetical protein